MKCSDLQNNLGLYAHGSLTESESASAKSHLEMCPLCRQRYTEYREIKNGLALLARPEMSAALKRSIKQAVVSEVPANRRSWLPFAPDVREFLQMRVMPYGVGAFASVLICGGFLVVMFSGVLRNGSLPAEKGSPMMAANHSPFLKEGDISAIDLVQSRLGFASESPSINPQGALVALTKSLLQSGMKNNEVVVVADVYSDGLAQIAEVVEPSRNRSAVGQLERALDSSPDRTPFVPATLESRPESVRVVLKFQSVDVHANAKHNSRWQ